MTIVKRLLNVFYAPTETFEALTENRDWKDIWIPIIIMALVGLISSVILKEVMVDFQLDRIEQSIENNQRVPEDRKQEIIDQQFDRILDPSPLMNVLTYFSALIITPVRILFMALLALMVGNFIFGGQAKYGELLALSGYIYLINIVETVVKVPIMLSKWTMEVYTGLGLLDVGEFGDFIYHFLAQIDIFSIWRVILFAIGMGVIYKKSTGTFFVAMTIVWLILVSINSGLGALSG